MVRQKSSRKNLGRKNNGQSYFCKFFNVSVEKVRCYEQSRKHINAIQKHSQNDNLSSNSFNLREVCVRATNSQVFESENIRTEISPKYQSSNAETMSIERLSESNQSFKEPDNKENIDYAIILLHGYGGDGQDISMLTLGWKRFLKNTVFLCPDAHEICSINPTGFQWFDLNKEHCLNGDYFYQPR